MGGNRGFNLIELMMVVAITGILAAIAIPNYMTYQCKAKQSEAKSGLGAIRTSQEAFHAENGRYGKTLGVIGFDGLKGRARYNYTLKAVSCTTSGFVAQATGAGIDGDITVDIWTINHNGTLANLQNDCLD